MDIREFYREKKVLITGHTGFKGSWMCCMLKEFGAKVYGVGLQEESNSLYRCANVASKVCASYIDDIRDCNRLVQIFNEVKPEIVIHMAAQPLVRESYENPVYTYEVNVLGTVNVLECARHTDSVKSIVNVTTDKVYKNREWEWGYRECEELNGYDPYSNSKSCSELVTSSYVNSFFKDKKVAVSTMRAGNVIGGGDFAKDRIIPDCVRATVDKKSIVVRNPYSTRPFQHVLEPVYAYLYVAMRQYLDITLAGNYNVGPEESDCLKTGNLVDLFCDTWKDRAKEHKTSLDTCNYSINPCWENISDEGPHEANFLKLDCSKIKRVFGIKPRWNIKQTMEKLVEWYMLYYDGGDIDSCMRSQIEEYLSFCKM